MRNETLIDETAFEVP